MWGLVWVEIVHFGFQVDCFLNYEAFEPESITYFNRKFAQNNKAESLN